ncbi:MAG: imidazole glycerol phosphate synthase subunit HisH [Gemmatimonadaceae bacterium]
MNVAVVDYGVGNVASLMGALERAGVRARLDADVSHALRADAIVLPGVGAFDAAASQLGAHRDVIRDRLSTGMRCLGICLGMQLLFDGSDEGVERGIGFFAGRVTRLSANRVPQMGWNTLDECRDTSFAAAGMERAYFANSFACRPDSSGIVTAWSTHGADRFAAAVRVAGVTGVQFHPEKSSAPGIAWLRSFFAGDTT